MKLLAFLSVSVLECLPKIVVELMPDYKHEFKILTKITAGSVFPEKGYKGFEINCQIQKV